MGKIYEDGQDICAGPVHSGRHKLSKDGHKSHGKKIPKLRVPRLIRAK